MKVSFLGPGVAMLLLVFKVNAGSDWYVIDNYERHAGSYPIFLSVQSYDFGPGVNIEGSYFYKNGNTEVPLYGKHDTPGLPFCEVLDSNDYYIYLVKGVGYLSEDCEFQLVYVGKDLSGIWKRDGKSYPVNLKYVGPMNEEMSSGNSSVLRFWEHTVGHGFFWGDPKSHNRTSSNKINVIDKKTGEIVQVILPQIDKRLLGLFITTVFKNIPSEANTNKAHSNYYSTDSEVVVKYKWNKKTSKYEVIN